MSKHQKKQRILVSRLSHNITFLENLAESMDEEQCWKERSSCFAEISPLTDCRYIAIEGMSFGNLITEEYYIFKIRYMEGINKSMRIVFRSKIYSIKRIINMKEQDRMLNIIAHEIL